MSLRGFTAPFLTFIELPSLSSFHSHSHCVCVCWLDTEESSPLIESLLTGPVSAQYCFNSCRPLSTVVNKTGLSWWEAFVSTGGKLNIWSTTFKMQFVVRVCVWMYRKIRKKECLKEWCVCVCVQKCVATNSWAACSPVCLDCKQLALSHCCRRSTNTHSCQVSPNNFLQPKIES